MQIVKQVQFIVDGQAFESEDAAQAYIDSNADRVRVNAFVEHLKANGAQRVSKAVTEAIEKFIKFESEDVQVDEVEADTEGKQQQAVKPVVVQEESKQAQSVSESVHVHGPSEDDAEDPLAGLELD